MSTVKVVKALRKMRSLFDHGKRTLEYKPNTWIHPSVGKIYAFEDYESASTWTRDYPGSSLWEAEAEIFNTKPCMFCANRAFFASRMDKCLTITVRNGTL